MSCHYFQRCSWNAHLALKSTFFFLNLFCWPIEDECPFYRLILWLCLSVQKDIQPLHGSCKVWSLLPSVSVRLFRLVLVTVCVAFFSFGSVCSFVSHCPYGLQNNSITRFWHCCLSVIKKHSPKPFFFFLFVLSVGLKIEKSILLPLWGVKHFLETLSAAFFGFVWVCFGTMKETANSFTSKWDVHHLEQKGRLLQQDTKEQTPVW